jgi:hypothetical protein
VPGATHAIDLTGVFDGKASAVRVTSDVDLVAGVRQSAAVASGSSTDIALLSPGVPVLSTVAVPGPPTPTTGAAGLTGVLSLSSTGPAVVVRLDILDSVGDVSTSKTVAVGASSTATYPLPASAAGGTVVVTSPRADAVVVARSLVSSAGGAAAQLTVLQPTPPQIESGSSALVRTLR